MLKFYGEMMKRLSTDEDGVVSFEYVVVAACVVGAVLLAFGTGTGGALESALTGAIGKITGAINGITMP